MFGLISSPKTAMEPAAERLKKHKERCDKLRKEQAQKISTLEALNAELKQAVVETAKATVSIIGQLNNGTDISVVKKTRRKKK